MTSLSLAYAKHLATLPTSGSIRQLDPSLSPSRMPSKISGLLSSMRIRTPIVGMIMVLKSGSLVSSSRACAPLPCNRRNKHFYRCLDLKLDYSASGAHKRKAARSADAVLYATETASANDFRSL